MLIKYMTVDHSILCGVHQGGVFTIAPKYNVSPDKSCRNFWNCKNLEFTCSCTVPR